MVKSEYEKQLLVINHDLEKEWWHMLKNGDRTVLSKIYAAFVSPMFGYGMSIIADRELIKDCIQDVFIDLWKYRANLSDTVNIKFYLFKSLRNRIYTFTLKEKKKKDLDKQSQEALLIPSYEDTLINDQREEGTQRKIANAIEHLPLRQKEVIRHIYFENLSYEETSGLMEINIRSVYTLTWKALSTLRKSLPTIFLLFFSAALSDFCLF